MFSPHQAQMLIMIFILIFIQAKYGTQKHKNELKPLKHTISGPTCEGLQLNWVMDLQNNFYRAAKRV